MSAWPVRYRPSAQSRNPSPGPGSQRSTGTNVVRLPANDRLFPTTPKSVSLIPPIRPATSRDFKLWADGAKAGLSVVEGLGGRRFAPIAAAVTAVGFLAGIFAAKWHVTHPEAYRLANGPWWYDDPWDKPPTALEPYVTFDGPLTGQAIDYSHGWNIPEGVNEYGVWIASGQGANRGAHHSTYSLVRYGEASGYTIEPYLAHPAIQVLPAGLANPTPGTGATPMPVAPPYYAIPGLIPHPNSDSGNGEAPRPTPVTGGDPTWQVVITPPQPGQASAPVPAKFIPVPRTPPRDNVKEKKATVSGAAGILRVVGLVTESLDAINAGWEAIPEEKRPGMKRNKKGEWKRVWNPNPTFKVKYLYEHWDQVDAGQFAANLIKNQIEDYVIGRASSATSKAAKPWYDRTGRPVGFGTGPAM